MLYHCYTYYYKSLLWLWHPAPSLSFPCSLHWCSCKHQCRQLWRAVPFDLPSLSCVRGQEAVVSHTRYLTQSPELCRPPNPHPNPALLLPLPRLPSHRGRLSAFIKGQLHLYPTEVFTHHFMTDGTVFVNSVQSWALTTWEVWARPVNWNNLMQLLLGNTYSWLEEVWNLLYELIFLFWHWLK